LFFGICGGALFGIVVAAFVMWSFGSATADAALYTGMITDISFGAFVGAFAAYKGTA
jgi:hypothetical protein